jgi:hypothetical protein
MGAETTMGGGEVMGKVESTNPMSAAAFKLDEFNKVGMQQADALKAMQNEFSTLFEEAKRAYTDRIETEQKLTAELISNLSQVKTVTDGAKIYQDWVAKHLQLWAEDGRRMVSDSQKFCAAASRMMSGQAQVH